MATTTDDQHLLSPEQVAEYLGIPVQTIYKWRHKGTGPRSMKVGRHVRYRIEDIDAWLDSQADQPQPAA